MRKFFEVKEESKKFPDVETILPQRSDFASAGYDFHSKESVLIMPGESHLFWMDVKAVMYVDNVLQIYPRSGLATKRGLVLRNTVGIIDASYADNPDNDGNIGICLVNEGDMPQRIEIGDRIAQGIFVKYYIIDDDARIKEKVKRKRIGGYGSSGT